MTGPRFSLTLIAAALLVGCQHGPGGTLDPFGRTTIPPPQTGAASIHSSRDHYYGNPARPMVPVAAKPGNATAAAPQASPQPEAQKTSWASSAAPENRLTPIPPYEHQEKAAPAPQPPATPSVATSSPAPAKVSPPQAAPIDPTAPLKWASGNPAQPQPQPQTKPPAAPAAAPAQVATGQNVTVRREPVAENRPRIPRYGYTKDYTSVRGRLEYRAQSRVWAIRYIPTHGEKDAYGGQFILSDHSKLEAFAAGDYVTVHGTPVAGNAAGGPPHYMPTSVVSLMP